MKRKVYKRTLPIYIVFLFNISILFGFYYFIDQSINSLVILGMSFLILGLSLFWAQRKSLVVFPVNIIVFLVLLLQIIHVNRAVFITIILFVFSFIFLWLLLRNELKKSYYFYEDQIKTPIENNIISISDEFYSIMTCDNKGVVIFGDKEMLNNVSEIQFLFNENDYVIRDWVLILSIDNYLGLKIKDPDWNSISDKLIRLGYN